MSDSVEKLLGELTKKSKNIGVNIEEIIEEPDNDDDKKQKENLKKLEKTQERIEATSKQLKSKDISSSEARNRVRKYQRTLQKLNQQAGNTQNIGVISKAKPRPKNNNPNDVRCFIRYNNQGNPYRICSSGGDNIKDKPPAQITAPIPVEEFLNKLGRTYGELTEGQTREYHRIDMANRRFEERERNAPARDALDEVLREQRRLGGYVSQQKRLDESTERKLLKIKQSEIREKYKKLLKDSNFTKQTINAKIKQDLVKQAGLTKNLEKQFKDAGISTNITKSRTGTKVSKKDITQLKQQNQDLEKQIKNTKKTIKDGKELVEEQLDFTITKKPKIVSFD